MVLYKMSPLVPLIERMLIDFFKRHGATIDYHRGETSMWVGPTDVAAMQPDNEWIELRTLADIIATEIEVLLIKSNVSVHRCDPPSLT